MNLDGSGGTSASRRRFVVGTAAAAAALRLRGPCFPDPIAEDTHDEALAMLAATGPEYGGGRSNHGPMALEALAQLHRGDAAKAWVESYRRRLEPAPAAGRVLAANEREAALGKRDAFPDWEATFTALLREGPWRRLVGAETTRLLPGLASALAHGVIRVAHAARALAAKDTPPRRQELARALAYWASNHRPVLGDPGSGTGAPLVGLAAVPLLPDAERRLDRGGTDLRIAEATASPAFVRAAHAIGPAAAPAPFLAELLRTAARQFVRHGATSPILFCHAFTAVGAVQALWPFLDEAARTLACRHAWQLVAGIQSRFATAPFVAGQPEAAQWNDDLVDAAVADGDAHVIKLTAACAVAWREQAAPELVAATARVRELL